MAERSLPKPDTRVRFPSSAPNKKTAPLTGCFSFGADDDLKRTRRRSRAGKREKTVDNCFFEACNRNKEKRSEAVPSARFDYVSGRQEKCRRATSACETAARQFHPKGIYVICSKEKPPFGVFFFSFSFCAFSQIAIVYLDNRRGI